MVDLSKKPLWRVDEVASHFDVTERTIRLWIEHGLLKSEKYNNRSIRIPRESIIEFRLRSRFSPDE